MLTALEIENFKAFGERRRIEFRPITLLFGPNSGGKSSVTHALHYLREVLCEGNLDAHRTWSGGDSLDLGGIRNFVHGRSGGAPIRLKAEFTLSGAELPEYRWYAAESGEPLVLDLPEVMRGRIEAAAVEVEVDPDGVPVVRSFSVELNGEHFAEYHLPRERPHAEIRRINWAHPCLLLSENRSEEDSGLLAWMYESIGGNAGADTVIFLPRQGNGLPRFEARLAIPAMEAAEASDHADFESLLSTLLLGPVAVLVDRLREFRYVGPLRAMPPRHPEPRDRTGTSRWATGLKAWELLSHGDDAASADLQRSLLQEVSRWLEAEDRLDTGYRLEREVFKQVPSGIAEMVSDAEYIDRVEVLAETIRSLPDQARIVLRDVGRNLLLQPRDVGVGLSQIVPVIVALLDPGSELVALEQPELHLHPRQQAALGDALIEGLSATPNRVLIVETHSEHLILRILRRIRETHRKQAPGGRSLTPGQVRIQYVRRDGSVSRAQIIDVDVNGDLVDPWPDDFFEQDFKERFG